MISSLVCVRIKLFITKFTVFLIVNVACFAFMYYGQLCQNTVLSTTSESVCSSSEDGPTIPTPSTTTSVPCPTPIPIAAPGQCASSRYEQDLS